MRWRWTAILFAGLAATLTTIAFGAGEVELGGACGPGRPPTLAALDTDGDGVVSMEEFVAHAPDPAAIFQCIDTNGDGYLDVGELAAGSQRRHRGAPPSTFDPDGDGLVSRDDFIAQAPPRARDPGALFDKIDANQDGYVDSDELTNARLFRPPPQ